MSHKFTIGELRQAIVNSKAGKQSNIFRPTIGGSFIEIQHDILLGALDELATKAKFVDAGMDEPSNCDKLLTMLFVAHAEYGG